MSLCRFFESNSKLFYKCVIVCSEIFTKIILRNKISDYFAEPSIVLENRPPSTNSHARHFDPFFRKFKENEENSKKQNSSAWSPLICTSFQEK